MTVSTASSLAERVFGQAISKSRNGSLMWDETYLQSDWELLNSCSLACRELIHPRVNVVCALGKSGVAIGSLVAGQLDLPLIWIDSAHTLIPRSYSLNNRHTAIIDSHSLHFWSARIAFNLLRTAGARSSQLVTLVGCDHIESSERELHHDELEKAGCSISQVISVSENKHYLQELFDELDEDISLINDNGFWRRQ